MSPEPKDFELFHYHAEKKNKNMGGKKEEKAEMLPLLPATSGGGEGTSS